MEEVLASHRASKSTELLEEDDAPHGLPTSSTEVLRDKAFHPVCICVCAHTCMFICVCECVYVGLYAHVGMSVCVYIFICGCEYVCLYAHMWV